MVLVAMGEHFQGPAVNKAAAVQRSRGKRDEQVGEVSRSSDEMGPLEGLAQSCLFSIHSFSVPSPRSQCLSFLHLFCFLSFCYLGVVPASAVSSAHSHPHSFRFNLLDV